MEESVRKSGKPGNRQESVWESGEPGDMQESVCESGESAKVLSLRALRARALAVTTFRHSCGPILVQLGTNLGPTWDQSGTNLGPIWDQFGTNLGQIWDQCGNMFGAALESENEHFSLGVRLKPKTCSSMNGKRV